ncbi:MAG TPA: NrtA/SsuA/CpmA family ABC transporter substrate-binding protein, partial [Nitrospiraceae bacterium]|nr:NrtA/SsuA/CpmA family ABC transporter substrate-binding protein [Nitrospiraceae bacterium]
MLALVMMMALSAHPGPDGSLAYAEPRLPIKIGYQSTSSDDWLFFAARDLKLFEKVGLAPEYVPFVAGPPMIDEARSGHIDVAIVKVLPFLSALSQGVDLVMIGIASEGAYSEGLVVRRDSGIDTPGDLKGKRIGYFAGSSAHYGLIMTLRQHGISRHQVKLFDMPPEHQIAALMKGELDAAMVWEPWIQRMVHEANARLIAIEGDLGIYTNVATISVQREWLGKNRETAVRFLHALILAYDALQRNHTIAVRAVVNETGTKKEWVEQIYRDAPPPNIHLWADPRYIYSLVKGAVFHRRLGYVAKFMLDEKVFPREVDTDDVLD